MTTIPYVYNFNPGGRTIQRIIKGVYTCLKSTSGSHYWEVVEPDADTDTTGWTKLKIRKIANPAETIRLVLQGSYLELYYTPPGGTESPFAMVSGGLTSTGTNSLSIYGISGVSVFVVELPDAFCIYNEKRSGSGLDTSAPDGTLMGAYCVGRIFSPHDRNKTSLEYGILAGGFATTGNTRDTNNIVWLHYDALGLYTALSTTRTATGTGVSQSMVYSGVNTIGENGWIRVGSFVTMNRDKEQPAPFQDFGGYVGSGSRTLQRFSPVGVMGPLVQRAVNLTWGTRNINRTIYPSGHFGYTRYFRAAPFYTGETYPTNDIYYQPWQVNDGLVKTGAIINSADPNVGWRITAGRNHVVIWCRGGQEINVGTITI